MKTVLLGDVAQIISGQSPQSINYNHKGEGLPLYQGKKDFGAMFTADPTVWTTQTTKIAEKGDILISVRAPVGPVNFASQKMNIGRGLAAIRPLEGLDSKYLYLYMKLNELEITKLGGGATFDSINRNHLKNIEIPYPAIEVQRRVVKKLDEAFEKINKAIELTQKNLQNSQNLFSSILKEELKKDLDTFQSEKLGTIFALRNGRSFKKTEWSKEGLPIIRIQNLKNPKAEFNYFKGEYLKEIEVHGGDLLFSWSGTVGTSFGPHFWYGPTAVLNQHIFKLNKLIDIDDKYAYFALREITSEIEKQTHGAGGLVHITKPKLQKFKIPIPSIEKQRQIAKYLSNSQDRVSKLQKLYQQKLGSLQELKKTLLDKAFKGEL